MACRNAVTKFADRLISEMPEVSLVDRADWRGARSKPAAEWALFYQFKTSGQLKVNFKFITLPLFSAYYSLTVSQMPSVTQQPETTWTLT
jgi:hypothetical protein